MLILWTIYVVICEQKYCKYLTRTKYSEIRVLFFIHLPARIFHNTENSMLFQSYLSKVFYSYFVVFYLLVNIELDTSVLDLDISFQRSYQN